MLRTHSLHARCPHSSPRSPVCMYVVVVLQLIHLPPPHCGCRRGCGQLGSSYNMDPILVRFGPLRRSISVFRLATLKLLQPPRYAVRYGMHLRNLPTSGLDHRRLEEYVRVPTHPSIHLLRICNGYPGMGGQGGRARRLSLDQLQTSSGYLHPFRPPYLPT